MRAQSSPSLVELHSMRERAISLSLSLLQCSSCNSRKYAKSSAKSKSSTCSHFQCSLLSSLYSLLCRSEQLKLRIRIGDTQSARHAQVVAVVVSKRGRGRWNTQTNEQFQSQCDDVAAAAACSQSK